MESSVIGAKGQVVIPTKIRAMFNIRSGTRVHFNVKHGEIVLILRLAPRPPAVGSLRIPPPRQRSGGSTPLTPRYFEHMAGCLGTGGKATKALLEERKRERVL